jgi:hypothetical protein
VNGTPGDACVTGFEWRLATDTDFVCVLPDVRAQVLIDNEAGPSRVAPES